MDTSDLRNLIPDLDTITQQNFALGLCNKLDSLIEIVAQLQTPSTPTTPTGTE